VASLSQGRTAAAQCGLFTHKSVPVIFEPPCNYNKRPCRIYEILLNVFHHKNTYIIHKLSRRHFVTKKTVRSSQVYLFYSGRAWFKFSSGVSSVYPDHPLSPKLFSSTSFAIDSHTAPRRYIL